jgi:hypothetical protein
MSKMVLGRYQNFVRQTNMQYNRGVFVPMACCHVMEILPTMGYEFIF